MTKHSPHTGSVVSGIKALREGAALSLCSDASGAAAEAGEVPSTGSGQVLAINLGQVPSTSSGQVTSTASIGAGQAPSTSSGQALTRTEGPVLEMALASDGEPPRQILLIPAGSFGARDGRQWINDCPQEIVEAFARNGADVPFDYEHATEKKGPLGEEAPATGWIKSLFARDDGSIWADVEWNAEGLRAITGKAYRYYSPAFFHTKDGRVRALSSAGLTNKPALQLPALAREAATDTEETMKEFLEKLGEALGLQDATEESVLKRCRELGTELATAREQVSLPDPAQFVTRADHELALTRARAAEEKLAGIEEAAQEREIEELVGGAIKDGKVAPASRRHYMALCRTESGIEAFKSLVGTLPRLGEPSNLDGRKPPEFSVDRALTREADKIAKMFGNSREDLEKYAG